MYTVYYIQIDSILTAILLVGKRQVTSFHLCLSFLQIDWPAPQDKKRECVAKGKNNQVM